MPKKRLEEQAVDEIMSSAGKCGHINRHSRGVRGAPDNLACTKDRGHDGNHGAEHDEYAMSDVGEIEVGGKRFTHVRVWREWGNAAGIEPGKIIPEVLEPKPQDTERAELIKNLVGGLIPPGTQIG